MPAYLIADTKSVSDPALMDEYRQAARPSLAAHGAKILAGGEAVALEGDWAPHEMIVIEFESMEKLRAWYDSPEYQAALPKRLKSSQSNVVILES